MQEEFSDDANKAFQTIVEVVQSMKDMRTNDELPEAIHEELQRLEEAKRTMNNDIPAKVNIDQDMTPKMKDMDDDNTPKVPSLKQQRKRPDCKLNWAESPPDSVKHHKGSSTATNPAL